MEKIWKVIMSPINLAMKIDLIVANAIDGATRSIEKKSRFNRFFLSYLLVVIFTIHVLLEMLRLDKSITVVSVILVVGVSSFIMKCISNVSKLYSEDKYIDEGQLIKIADSLKHIAAYRLLGWFCLELMLPIYCIAIIKGSLTLFSIGLEILPLLVCMLSLYLTSSKEGDYVHKSRNYWMSHHKARLGI
ncbi:hypothetical protein ACFL08_04550 [Patescibacteria group bacterium]